MAARIANLQDETGRTRLTYIHGDHDIPAGWTEVPRVMSYWTNQGGALLHGETRSIPPTMSTEGIVR